MRGTEISHAFVSFRVSFSNKPKSLHHLLGNLHLSLQAHSYLRPPWTDLSPHRICKADPGWHEEALALSLHWSLTAGSPREWEPSSPGDNGGSETGRRQPAEPADSAERVHTPSLALTQSWASPHGQQSKMPALLGWQWTPALCPRPGTEKNKGGDGDGVGGRVRKTFHLTVHLERGRPLNCHCSLSNPSHVETRERPGARTICQAYWVSNRDLNSHRENCHRAGRSCWESGRCTCL